MNKLRALVITSLGLATVSLNVMALDTAYTEEEDAMALYYQDEEMISITTGTEKPVHLAPSVATVITANDIKMMGARNLDEVLEFVPGLHVSRDPARQSPIFSIRGIHTNFNPQVVLLLNGHAINEPLTGGRPPIFKLPVANISRIEIIRGPGSAVHGADAFAGVINVITKSTDELSGLTSGVRTGSFDSQDVWLQAGSRLADWKTAFSFEYSRSDGDKNRKLDSDLQSTFDQIFSSNASLTPGTMNTKYEVFNTSLDFQKDNWHLWLNSWNLNNAGLGVGAAQALDPVGKQINDLYTAKLDYQNDNLSEYWKLATNVTYRKFNQQTYYKVFPNNALLPVGDDGNLFTPGGGLVLFTDGVLGNPGAKIDHVSFESAFTYHRFSDHLIRLAFGLKYDKAVANETKNFGPGVIDGTTLTNPINIIDGTLTNVTGTNNIYMPESSRRIRYISVQDEWKFANDWELTGGIRYDYYSDFGDTINPRLALVWAMKYNLTSKLLYGRAFRAPSFTELYFINNPGALGDPNLDPEVIDMLELVFDYRPNFDLDIMVNLFRYQADDLIDYKAGGTAENLRDQRGYGMELDVEHRTSKRITFLANYAWQRSKDRDTLHDTPNAPGRQLSLALRIKTDSECSISGQLNHVMDRARAYTDLNNDGYLDKDPRDPIKDYTTIDVVGRCSGMKDMPLEIAASIRNALNEDVREPAPITVYNDFPQEGRSLYIELSYYFE